MHWISKFSINIFGLPEWYNTHNATVDRSNSGPHSVSPRAFSCTGTVMNASNSGFESLSTFQFWLCEVCTPYAQTSLFYLHVMPVSFVCLFVLFCFLDGEGQGGQRVLLKIELFRAQHNGLNPQPCYYKFYQCSNHFNRAPYWQNLVYAPGEGGICIWKWYRDVPQTWPLFFRSVSAP